MLARSGVVGSRHAAATLVQTHYLIAFQIRDADNLLQLLHIYVRTKAEHDVSENHVFDYPFEGRAEPTISPAHFPYIFLVRL